MTSRTETVVVERSEPGKRLDIYLREKFPAVSRGILHRLIEEGHVRIDGHGVKPTHSPRAGETIEVHWPDVRPAEAQGEDIPLDILYEDDSLVVINKPAGLVVHPASGHEISTLVNALLHHCDGQLSGIGGVARPGIVHRLDKDTSGCLVAAKNDQSHLALAAQFAGRTIHKVYHTMVCGEVARDQGEIRAAISRHCSHRKCMAVDDEYGREAHTSYRVLERLNNATLAEAIIHTGRTHQIRVHFQFIGYPVVGDQTYGKRQNKKLEELTGCTAERQMLHAYQLSFTHPGSGEVMNFEAPYPPDFVQTLQRLRTNKEEMQSCLNETGG